MRDTEALNRLGEAALVEHDIERLRRGDARGKAGREAGVEFGQRRHPDVPARDHRHPVEWQSDQVIE